MKGLPVPFEVVVSERTQMVVQRGAGRCLGGAGSNFYRCWAFPLYTPSGLTVVQEFPFDHPFHNGCFVGQSPVVGPGGRPANFWAAPPPRGPDDKLFVHVGRMDCPAAPSAEVHDRGVRLTFQNVWRGPDEQPVLQELRTVDLCAAEDATVCDLTSRKVAAYGPLEYPQTKFGSIGIRVEPRLLPALGGVVLADGGRRGRAAVVHERDSAFVAYENDLGGGRRFGVLMSILDAGVRGPWFIRDYGMALYNPTWRGAVATPEGASWTVSLRVVAYDGALTEERTGRWAAAPRRS